MVNLDTLGLARRIMDGMGNLGDHDDDAVHCI